MKFKFTVQILTAFVVLAVSTQFVRASQVIYDGVGFLVGTQSFEDTFSLSGPGTLSVTLTDFDWPSPLSSLDMVVSTAQGALGPESGAGTVNYQISNPSTVSAQWFGTAAGPLDTGLVGLEVQFTPSATTVPLPTSIVLLLSGLAFLVWQRRMRPAASGARTTVAAQLQT